jgi:hypothetical protein
VAGRNLMKNGFQRRDRQRPKVVLEVGLRRLHPSEVRYSGVSFGFQTGFVIGGAFAPMAAATGLLSSFGWPSVALYMMPGCLLTLVSVRILAKRNDHHVV